MEKVIEMDAFDFMVESFKNTKGYVVVFVTGKSDGCERYTILHYDNEVDFRKDFTLRRHAYYPCNVVTPLHVIEEDGNSLVFKANGVEIELYEADDYLIIDGKLVR